jgi:hypothetical protein
VACVGLVMVTVRSRTSNADEVAGLEHLGHDLAGTRSGSRRPERFHDKDSRRAGPGIADPFAAFVARFSQGGPSRRSRRESCTSTVCRRSGLTRRSPTPDLVLFRGESRQGSLNGFPQVFGGRIRADGT